MGNTQNPSITYNMHKLEPFWSNNSEKSQSLMLQPNSTFLAGQVMGQVTNAAVSAQQTLTQTATGGTFTLSYGGQTSASLNWNATASQVSAALSALTNVGSGQVTCTGGPLNTTPVVVNFTGQLAGMPVTAITVNSSLTGGSLSVAQTTAGVAYGRYKAYASGNSDGSQYPKCFLTYDCVTDSFGNVFNGNGGTTAPEFGSNTTTQAWFKGEFLVSALTGLDANALGILGRLTVGTALTDPNAVITLN